MSSEELRSELVQSLAESGVLICPKWRRAFRRVRREAFVPRFWRETDRGWECVSGSEEWLRIVYSDEVLMLSTDGEPPSSSSMPSVMARMLESLAVRDGDRVLEIGTGSGYNAALLCERLGSESVTTIDCNAELVEAARTRLAEHGYELTVVAGDGIHGYAPNAPYDRVIATCAVRQVPRAWIDQTRPGGRVLAMFPHGMAQLTVTADGSAEGWFHPHWFSFMQMQNHWRREASPSELRALIEQGGETRPYEYPALADEEDGRSAYFFLVQLVVYGHRVGLEVDSRNLAVDLWDASWSVLDSEAVTVTQSGPRRLWDSEVALYDAWCSWRRPSRERFGLTVPADGGPQMVWLDDPRSEQSWTLAGWEPE